MALIPRKREKQLLELLFSNLYLAHFALQRTTPRSTQSEQSLGTFSRGEQRTPASHNRSPLAFPTGRENALFSTSRPILSRVLQIPRGNQKPTRDFLLRTPAPTQGVASGAHRAPEGVLGAAHPSRQGSLPAAPAAPGASGSTATLHPVPPPRGLRAACRQPRARRCRRGRGSAPPGEGRTRPTRLRRRGSAASPSPPEAASRPGR